SSVTVLDQAGAVVSGLLALGKVQGRLLGYTQSKIYDLSEAENRWIDRGRATSWRVRKRAIVSADPSSNMVGSGDMAVLGSYRCYAYDIYTPGTGINTRSTTYFTLVDADGARIASNQQLATLDAADPRTSGVKVVAHGVRFYIVFYDYSTAATLKTFVIDTTSATTIAT